jgi:hypothetical protein
MAHLVRPLTFVALAVTISSLQIVATAAQPSTDAFFRTWERTERPVSDQATNRTWMWGPTASTGSISEPYIESPGRYREVQYFDKTRMEINNPLAYPDSLWFVTNGLLAKELITGRVQVGNLAHEHVESSRSQIAGDRHPDSPTYAMLEQLLGSPAHTVGEEIDEQIAVSGSDFELFERRELRDHGVTAAYFVTETGHSVASPFWEFMNSSGLIHEHGVNVHGNLFEDPFFATGFPITEAYWAHIPVGGVWQDVLLQCFERRCLTYTPDNPSGWQVEAGNIGQHYHQFRYGRDPEVLDCVELNLSTPYDLLQLVNIGESRAQAILDHRPFNSVEELEQIPGIGPVTVEQIIDQGLACIVYDPEVGKAFHQSR